MFLFFIEKCHCKNDYGEPGKNEIICDKGSVASQLFTKCDKDDWCTGVSDPDKAEYGTRKEDLCSKGKLYKIYCVIIYHKFNILETIDIQI